MVGRDRAGSAESVGESEIEGLVVTRRCLVFV